MIDVSMLESMLSLTLSEIQSAQFSLPPLGRPIFGPVAAKDGYINLSIASERTFQNLAVASGHPQWITDPRFAQYPDRPCQLGRIDRRARGLVHSTRHRKSRRCSTPRRTVFALSHGSGSNGRSATRASRRLCRGARCRRYVRCPQPAIPILRNQGRRRPSCRGARRGHRTGVDRARLRRPEIAVLRG